MNDNILFSFEDRCLLVLTQLRQRADDQQCVTPDDVEAVLDAWTIDIDGFGGDRARLSEATYQCLS